MVRLKIKVRNCYMDQQLIQIDGHPFLQWLTFCPSIICFNISLILFNTHIHKYSTNQGNRHHTTSRPVILRLGETKTVELRLSAFNNSIYRFSVSNTTEDINIDFVPYEVFSGSRTQISVGANVGTSESIPLGNYTLPLTINASSPNGETRTYSNLTLTVVPPPTFSIPMEYLIGLYTLIASIAI
jgi:hypothetical protein